MKVISSEEFSFENINNLTSGKGLKILTVIFRKDLAIESLIYIIGSLKQKFVWNEKNIKAQVKSSLAWMAYFKILLNRLFR